MYTSLSDFRFRPLWYTKNVHICFLKDYILFFINCQLITRFLIWLRVSSTCLPTRWRSGSMRGLGNVGRGVFVQDLWTFYFLLNICFQLFFLIFFLQILLICIYIYIFLLLLLQNSITHRNMGFVWNSKS